MKSLVRLLSVMLPVACKSDVTDTLSTPEWVIDPLAITVRLFAEMLPSIMSLISVMEMSVPLARMVPKSLAWVSVIAPEELKWDVPVETFDASVCVIAP